MIHVIQSFFPVGLYLLYFQLVSQWMSFPVSALDDIFLCFYDHVIRKTLSSY